MPGRRQAPALAQAATPATLSVLDTQVHTSRGFLRGEWEECSIPGSVFP